MKAEASLCSLPIIICLTPLYIVSHGLLTLNEGINQRNLKFWADMADKNMLWPYLKIWDWDLIFGRAVKAISSSGVRSP